MGKRVYFTINEESAQEAHTMMSVHKYAECSTTKAYQAEVDKVYEMADAVAEKQPTEADRAYELAERYSKKLAEYFNKKSSIGMICPSILVSGGANFPVKKKQKQVEALDRNQLFYAQIQEIPKKIKKILDGNDVIRSDDERAIEKLEEKLEDLKSQQELMKTANKAIRLKNTEDGDDKLREFGFSEKQIKALRTPDFCGRVGFADYKLTNNNANIHRIEKRIESLKTVKAQDRCEQEYQSFKTVENTDIMRYQIVFYEKPDEEIRTLLKANGFKWAPSQEAWQRQITANGKWAFERVVQKLVEWEATL